MVDNLVDSERQLSISAFKNLKKMINAEFTGPQGPTDEFAGEVFQYLPIHTILTNT